jgi:hypothetical protein
VTVCRTYVFTWTPWTAFSRECDTRSPTSGPERGGPCRGGQG